ncbi:major facilitator superfamily domain-containing protein, partial [Lobosporangium transversale]
YGVIMPITPFILEDLGYNSTANGGLVACYGFGHFIASPIAGIISDRLNNRRKLMIAGLISLLMSTFLFMESTESFSLLLLSRFCAGLAGGSTVTLGFALLSDTYPSNQLGVEMGKALVGQAVGLMAGPPLGGALLEHVGPRAPYIFCLVLIGLDLCVRLSFIEAQREKVKAIKDFLRNNYNQPLDRITVQSPSDDTLDYNSTLPSMTTTTCTSRFETIKGLLSSKRLITALSISFLDGFLFAVFEPVLPLYLSRQFNLSETLIGLSFLALNLPTFISPIAGWFSDKHGAKIMSAVAIGFCTIFVVLLGLPGNPLWAIVLLLTAIGSMFSIYLTPVLGEISAVVRTTGAGDGFARALACSNMCFSLGTALGSLLGTVVYEGASMIWTCVLIAIANMCVLPLVLLF